MDFAWLYIAVASLGAGAAVFVRVAVRGQTAKQRIGAWSSIIVGIVFFLLYVTKVDRDVFVWSSVWSARLSGHTHLRRSACKSASAGLSRRSGDTARTADDMKETICRPQ